MAIVKVYANLILSGHKTIDEVPQRIRLAVETYLEELKG